MTSRLVVDPAVKRLWEELEDKEQAIVMERRRLQSVWKQISAMHKSNAEAREEFEKKAAFDFVPAEDRIILNVGGHVFETTAGVLCRDRYSLLACICKTSPPISRDKKGAFFFDRDWWIFRYILQFLRTGDLPEDRALLREMHDEAAFYRLNSLRRATERRAASRALAASSPQSIQGQNNNPHASSRQHWRSTTAGASRMELRGDPQAGRPWSPSPNRFRAPLPDPYGFSYRR